MEKLKNKKLWIIMASITIVIIILLVLFLPKLKMDGLENDSKIKFYYRTHSKSGWSKWSYNGVTSGVDKTSIDGIQFKNRTRLSGEVYIRTHNKTKWQDLDCTNKEKCEYKTNVDGIKASLTGIIDKNYDIYYRVHTKKHGWLTWISNGEGAGINNDEIDKIQIKIIPKYAFLYDYLKGYEKDKNTNMIEE